ncbi:hypothetical protein [Sphingomonas faeni]|nr:hypothetical protein [Sphingomonas faeni]
MQQQMQAQVAQQVAYQNLTHSRNRAVEKYGKEQMDEVADWAGQQANANPQFEAQLFAQADPAEWVIAEKKRADELSAFTANREAFIRAEAAKLGFAEISAQPVMEAQFTVARKPSGPASIVNAKSRETVAPHKPEDAFDAIFKKS